TLIAGRHCRPADRWGSAGSSSSIEGHGADAPWQVFRVPPAVDGGDRSRGAANPGLRSGARIASLDRMVRLAVVCACLAACHPSARTYPAVAQNCASDRIGQVTVEGAGRADVAGLTVLEGTRDNQARTQRIAHQTIDALRTRGYARAKLVITREQMCRGGLHRDVTLGPPVKIRGAQFGTDER